VCPTYFNGSQGALVADVVPAEEEVVVVVVITASSFSFIAAVSRRNRAKAKYPASITGEVLLDVLSNNTRS
jgi:hypothetical protein